MSQMQLQPEKRQENTSSIVWKVVKIMVAGLVIFAGLVVYLLSQSPLGPVLGSSLNQLFAVDSVQLMWYITRAAGLTGYILLWLSTAWGLAVSSKIFDKLLHRAYTYDFHQFLSLLAIGFILLHIAVLMADRYLPYTLAQVLVPFLSPYRPIWVGVGVLAFYLTLLVTVTFYLRSRIGAKTFRTIHVLSLVAFLGAAVHGFFSGTDSPLLATQVLYAGTFLSVVFLTSYWLIYMVQKRLQKPQTENLKQTGHKISRLGGRSHETRPETHAHRRRHSSAHGRP
ncbi:MAG: ferric reductase-like transmembrane domain-containing protein [Anaerolineales bacterium]